MATLRELVIKLGFTLDSRQIDLAERRIASFKKNADDMRSSLVGITVAATAIGAGVGFFINEAAKMEQTNVAFEVLLGGADAANKKIQELTNFARNTPFTITGILESSQQLLAYGIEAKKLIPTLGFLGDISLGNQFKFERLAYALGQISSTGTLKGDDLRQLTEAGVGRGDLAKAMGIDIKDFADKVERREISFEMVEKAMVSLTSKGGRFFGMMDKGSRTLLGIISNIKDSLTLLAVEIGNSVLPQAKNLAKEFLNYVEVNRKLIKTNILAFFKAMIDFLKFTLGIIYAVVRVFNLFSKAVGGTERAVSLLSKAIMIFIGLKLAHTLGSIIISLYRVATAATAATALPIAIAAAIGFVVLIIEDLITYFQGGNSVFGLMVKDMRKHFPITFMFLDKLHGALKVLKGDFDALYPKSSLDPSKNTFLNAFSKNKTPEQLQKESELNRSVIGGLAKGMMFFQNPLLSSQAPVAGNTNKSSVFNINIEAPVNVSGAMGSAKQVIQNHITDTWGTILRDTQRANNPQLEF